MTLITVARADVDDRPLAVERFPVDGQELPGADAVLAPAIHQHGESRIAGLPLLVGQHDVPRVLVVGRAGQRGRRAARAAT